MPGPHVFELDEVNELIPTLEEVFVDIEEVRKRLRTLHIRINALGMIWGTKVEEDDNPDHGEFMHHIERMEEAKKDFEEVTKRFKEMGAQVKNLDPGLLDFYGVRDGNLIYWCWTRGETSITHWHHIDEGFAGRQKV